MNGWMTKALKRSCRLKEADDARRKLLIQFSLKEGHNGHTFHRLVTKISEKPIKQDLNWESIRLTLSLKSQFNLGFKMEQQVTKNCKGFQKQKKKAGQV